MNTPLLALGLALVGFGAVVLLRFADRPGATLKWMGLELSSKGAGLPLIGLGVVCVVLAVQAGSPAPGPAAPDPSSTAEAPGASQDAGSQADRGLPEACLREVAAAVPGRRVREVEEGSRDVLLIDSTQPQDEPFVVVLTDGGEAVGALRARSYNGDDASARFFKLEAVVDARCADVEEVENVSRGGDPRALPNWDTVRLRLGGRRYDLRVGGEGDIGVGYFRRVP